MSQIADSAFYRVRRRRRMWRGPARRLPLSPDAMAVTSNLVLHRSYARKLGLRSPPSRWEDEQVRSAARIIDRVLEITPAPLAEARAPDQRMIVNCHHAALLTCALLRTHGVPVRARAGFAPYLAHGDHWICELLTPAGWQRFDPDIGLPPGDAKAASFLTGGEAWLRCRTGDADPELFGFDRWRGWWFIRNNVIRDFAALCKLELLPWDRWGFSRHLRLIDDPARRAEAHRERPRLARPARHDSLRSPAAMYVGMRGQVPSE